MWGHVLEWANISHSFKSIFCCFWKERNKKVAKESKISMTVYWCVCFIDKKKKNYSRDDSLSLAYRKDQVEREKLTI